MKLHEFENDFNDLIALVAKKKHIPESAVERDYYIVMLLENLQNSEFAEKCVFKGGTSLSKCYPGSIERFSEDIDLTFLGMDLPDKKCDKAIKKIEQVMTVGAQTEKINSERSNRSKSMYVWFFDKDKRIKLEIGSSIRPDPYSKKEIKTYIQEFLEEMGAYQDVEKFELKTVSLLVLNIERTFVDKLMSVKRHAICGNIKNKVRHIYDVTRLWSLPEIQNFMLDTEELKRLVQTTKETDSFYLEKRNISEEYDPKGPYGFEKWSSYLNSEVEAIYKRLHETLLYTDQQQNFKDAIKAFSEIDEQLKSIGE